MTGPTSGGAWAPPEVGPTGFLGSILAIEDDPSTALLYGDVFGAAGYLVRHATTGAAARESVCADPPDLVLLDLILPDVDGIVLCLDLRERTDAPIVVISGSKRRRDEVLCLRLGADDFIAKPFDLDILQARIAATLRRKLGDAPGATVIGASAPHGASGTQLAVTHGAIRLGGLRVDTTRQRVTLAGRELPLTRTEYGLLAALAERSGAVVSRHDLATAVWGYDDAGIARAITVHMVRLRRKLAEAGRGATVPIVAVRGRGYRLESPTDVAARLLARLPLAFPTFPTAHQSTKDPVAS
jgi:DNA-binding response OmpR family regulator